MVKIAPSILSADFSKLGDEVKAVEDAGADWIHIDVMDGQFVPNITVGPLVVEAVRKVTKLPLDVHLMIQNADNYIKDFAQAGADILSVQVEACPHLHRTVQLIRSQGVSPAVVLNPATTVFTLDEIIEHVDMVLLMSVNPGFGGQSFIPMMDKVRRLREMIGDRPVHIEIDGGVTPETAPLVAAAGADVLVAGSAVYKGADAAEYGRLIAEIRAAAEREIG